MPSVFTLEGPRGLSDVLITSRPGANATPRGYGPMPPSLPGSGGFGPQAGGFVPVPYGNSGSPGGSGITGAALAGLGEMSDRTKTGLIALFTLSVVGLVFYHSMNPRPRGLRGSRRRRRRR